MNADTNLTEMKAAGTNAVTISYILTTPMLHDWPKFNQILNQMQNYFLGTPLLP